MSQETNDLAVEVSYLDVDFIIGGRHTPADWLTGEADSFSISMILVGEQDVLPLFEAYAPKLLEKLERLACREVHNAQN